MQIKFILNIKKIKVKWYSLQIEYVSKKNIKWSFKGK